METDKRSFGDRPNRIPWPPIFYAVALVAGWPLAVLFPLPWADGIAAEVMFAAGILIIVGALAIDLAAMTALHRAKTTIMPHRRVHHLITKGVFSLSRNPIYVAHTMLVIAAGLISGIAWYFPLALLAAFLTQKLGIAREEKHLEARFGRAFREYRKRVNRWL